MCDGPLGNEDDGSVVTFATRRLISSIFGQFYCHGTPRFEGSRAETIVLAPFAAQAHRAGSVWSRADKAADATIAGTVVERRSSTPGSGQHPTIRPAWRTRYVKPQHSPNLGFHLSWPAIRFRLLRPRLLCLPRPHGNSNLGPVETAPVTNSVCAITRRSARLKARNPHPSGSTRKSKEHTAKPSPGTKAPGLAYRVDNLAYSTIGPVITGPFPSAANIEKLNCCI